MKKLKKAENIRKALQERIARFAQSGLSKPTPPAKPAETAKSETTQRRRETKVAVA